MLWHFKWIYFTFVTLTKRFFNTIYRGWPFPLHLWDIPLFHHHQLFYLAASIFIRRSQQWPPPDFSSTSSTGFLYVVILESWKGKILSCLSFLDQMKITVGSLIDCERADKRTAHTQMHNCTGYVKNICCYRGIIPDLQTSVLFLIYPPLTSSTVLYKMYAGAEPWPNKLVILIYIFTF